MPAIAWPLAIAFALASSGSHMKDGFAYSRETLGGIPESGGRSLETTYFVYVVLPKGAAAPTSASVWLKGRHYAATVRKVATPVQVEHDPAIPSGSKDTLVPATASEVYQVIPGEPQDATPADDAERQATQSNDVVVCLSSGRSSWSVPIKSLQALRPAPGR